MSIWDLVTLLLGRGFYRADPAPVPLDSILRNDPRFEHDGLLGWILAEAITPAKRVEIRQRQQAGRELLGFHSGEHETLEREAVAPSLAGRFTLERAMADIGALLAELDPATIDEANELATALSVSRSGPWQRFAGLADRRGPES